MFLYRFKAAESSVGCRFLRALCVLGVTLSLCLPAACSRDADGSAKTNERARKPVVSVTVAPAAEKDVPVQVRAIGNVQAFTTVNIKAQVDGAVTNVHFSEGQKVKKGDLIFTIDPRPFDARLRQAEANLAKEKVQLQTAKKDVERYAAVVKKGFVSEEKFDQVQSDAAVLEAAVRADEAAVESARLELKYCGITSPIDGYVGEIKVNQGNVVKANDNEKPLVIINQTSPIYVSFAVPEQNLPAIRKYAARGKLRVQVVVPGDEDRLEKGDLTFVDNAVNSATGTILLKATFNNEEGTLWPGTVRECDTDVNDRERFGGYPLQGGSDRPAGPVRLRGEGRLNGGIQAGVRRQDHRERNRGNERRRNGRTGGDGRTPQAGPGDTGESGGRRPERGHPPVSVFDEHI